MSRYSITSSANNLTEQSPMASQISLIKIKNKIGPSTLPWGTPLRVNGYYSNFIAVLTH